MPLNRLFNAYTDEAHQLQVQCLNKLAKAVLNMSGSCLNYIIRLDLGSLLPTGVSVKINISKIMQAFRLRATVLGRDGTSVLAASFHHAVADAKHAVKARRFLFSQQQVQSRLCSILKHEG